MARACGALLMIVVILFKHALQERRRPGQQGEWERDRREGWNEEGWEGAACSMEGERAEQRVRKKLEALCSLIPLPS